MHERGYGEEDGSSRNVDHLSEIDMLLTISRGYDVTDIKYREKKNNEDLRMCCKMERIFLYESRQEVFYDKKIHVFIS